MINPRRTKLFKGAAVGVVLTIVGLIGWIDQGSLIYVFLHLVGIILFLEFILMAYQIKPYPVKFRKYLLHILGLVLLGTFTGVFLFDIVGLFIFKLWDYPVFSPVINTFGYAVVSFGWGLYFLIFHQSYILLHHLLHKGYRPPKLTNGKKLIYIGPVGIILVLLGAAFPRMLESTALSGLMMAIGAWFILEGFEWPRKRKTLLLDLLSGNIRPLIAIVVGAFMVGFLSEFANILAPTQQWMYYGIPWQNAVIFGVPVSLLLSWSIMYIIFLSLENILIRTEVELWD